jgi:hypothetical protein
MDFSRWCLRMPLIALAMVLLHRIRVFRKRNGQLCRSARSGRGWPARGAAPIVAIMSETPDLKALAERYLDLWEEQFSAAAADPALAAAMAAWLGPWRALAAGAGAMPDGKAGRKSDDRAPGTSTNTRGRSGAAEAARPAAAGAAPGDGGRGLERIVEQLHRIERRVDALERKRAGKGGGAGTRGGRARGAR